MTKCEYDRIELYDGKWMDGNLKNKNQKNTLIGGSKIYWKVPESSISRIPINF